MIFRLRITTRNAKKSRVTFSFKLASKTMIDLMEDIVTKKEGSVREAYLMRVQHAKMHRSEEKGCHQVRLSYKRSENFNEATAIRD